MSMKGREVIAFYKAIERQMEEARKNGQTSALVMETWRSGTRGRIKLVVKPVTRKGK